MRAVLLSLAMIALLSSALAAELEYGGSCPDTNEPVCSKKTGKTYKNECLAAQAGDTDSIVGGACPEASGASEEASPSEYSGSTSESEPEASGASEASEASEASQASSGASASGGEKKHSPKYYVTPVHDGEGNDACGTACADKKTFRSQVEQTPETEFGKGQVTVESTTNGAADEVPEQNIKAATEGEQAAPAAGTEAEQEAAPAEENAAEQAAPAAGTEAEQEAAPAENTAEQGAPAEESTAEESLPSNADHTVVANVATQVREDNLDSKKAGSHGQGATVLQPKSM